MKELTHISLFAGIGGIDLAAEWAGFKTILFVEIDPYCQKVLRKHWPEVPIIGDIRDATKEKVMDIAFGRGCFHGQTEEQPTERGKQALGESKPGSEYGVPPRRGSTATITLITGGFPCQPVSVAGKRRGTDDDRWLWPEMFRVISEVRSAWVVAENVVGLQYMGEPFGEPRVESKILTRTEREDYFHKIYTRQERMLLRTVIGNLEGEKYETLCLVIPACGVNAPHRRDRIFIVAHTEQPGTGGECGEAGNKRRGASEDRGEGLRQGDRATCPGGVDTTSEDVAISLDNRGGTPRCTEDRKGEANNEGGEGWSQPGVGGCGKDVADTILRTSRSTHRARSNTRGANSQQDNRNGLGNDIRNGSEVVSDSDRSGCTDRSQEHRGKQAPKGEGVKGIGGCGSIPNSRGNRHIFGNRTSPIKKGQENGISIQNGEYSYRATESGLGRMADGISHRMDPHHYDSEPDIPRVTKDAIGRVSRLKGLGNAVDPYQIYWLLKAIADIENV